MLIGRMIGHSFPGFGAIPTGTSIKTMPTDVQQQTTQVSPGMCTSDGGYIWDVGGFWRRLKAGEQCTALSSIQGDTRGHTDGSGEGGTIVGPGPDHGPVTLVYDFDTTQSAASADPNAAAQSLQVGPFKIPLGAREYTIHWTGMMPAEWAAFIIPELAHDCSNCVFTSMEDATAGHPLGTLRDFFGDALPSKVNKDLVSMPGLGFLVGSGDVVYQLAGGQTAPLAMKISLPDQPIAVVSRPDNGETWGMYMVILPRDPTYVWDSTTNPYVLNFFWRKQPTGVWDWIKHIVGEIISAVEAIACALAPVALKAPPTSAVTAGIVAGAVVLQVTGACTPNCPQGMTYNAAIKACACPPMMTYDAATKMCIPYVAPVDNSWMWWLAGGLGFLALIALGLKSKHEAATAT